MPRLIVLGAQKAGTSSLSYYLAQHPQVAEPFKKEIHYFDNNYHKGLPWYRTHFAKLADATLGGMETFEASPYYLFHPSVPRRIANDVPEAKFIVMLRDPVARAYSHYWHERRHGREALSFEDAIEAEEERLRGEAEKLENGEKNYSENHQRFSYVSRGCYAEQLKRWLTYIDRERFLFIKSERFFSDPRLETQRVYAFMGIESGVEVDWGPKNFGGYNREMKWQTRVRLRTMFASANSDLREIAGADFEWN